MDAQAIWEQILAAQKRIEEYEARLRRLRPVKETVAAKKREFDGVRSKDKTAITKKYNWQGEKYKTFSDDKGEDLLNEDDLFYKQGLDKVLDALCDEITRLENLIAGEHGLIGRLYALFNSIMNAIETATN